MENIVEKLESILKDLRERVPGIEAAIAISEEGFPLASSPGEREELLSAMALLAMETAKRVTEELGKERGEEVIIMGKKGKFVVLGSDNERCLAALTTDEVKTGVLLYELRKTLKEIEAVLSES